MYLIDTHVHLDMIKNLTPQEAVSLSLSEGVKYIINVGSSIEGSARSVEYAKKFDNVFAGVGIHPHEAGSFEEKQLEILENMIGKKVVAIGETGYDFYRNLSSKAQQEKVFIMQLELALKHNLPVIIHDRDAHIQTLNTIKRFTGEKRFKAVIHCFSGDINFAMECIEMGLFISFTGVITFPNAKELLKVVEKVPIEKIFVETDTPFLAPQAKRGKENFPGYVKFVAEKIAEIKGISVDEVASITSKNAINFFSLKINQTADNN